eukprot:TRINITY_DN36708_c0_g1_i1.p1 TRINITY_DN36708_c0_g1~~TRINITY_DN36708_c0_g1_i1.p1  ORF type:complete len:414 (+),score=33.75 TRINITY_DN36708_c0_g1_i1:68-1309(+)
MAAAGGYQPAVVSPRVSAASATEIKLEWKWADAGTTIPLVGAFAAHMNPLRWSSGSPTEVQEQLLSELGGRPVCLRVVGQSYTQEFQDNEEAAAWVGKCEKELSTVTEGTLSLSLAEFAAGQAAIPALAMFCRLHATEQPFSKRNIFVASAYARHVVNLPFKISRLQAEKRVDRHPRRLAEWSEFQRSSSRSLTQFVAAATLPPAERPATVVHGGSTYAYANAEDHSRFWAAFRCEGADKDHWILAFRGGDGGTEDAKSHPGSPARAFIAGRDPAELPVKDLPLNLIRGFSKSGDVTLVGYSQGGIPALGCALALGELPWLRECVLLNCATAFWPAWYKELLPDDWWSVPPPVSTKILAWVIRNDPLSDEVPGSSQRMPQVPGETVLLPAVASGAQIMDNHSFRHFVSEDTQT